jgi:hypothetical protein
VTEQFKDSGTRKEWSTGAHRDMVADKGRFDLLPFNALQEAAIVFERGGLKYTDRNWERGIPVWSFLSAGARHLHKAISGVDDEPHLSMALWNIMCAIQTEAWARQGRLPEELAYDKTLRLCLEYLHESQEADAARDGGGDPLSRPRSD